VIGFPNNITNVINNGTINHTGVNAGWDIDKGNLTNNSTGIINYTGSDLSIENRLTLDPIGTFDLSGKTVTFDGGNGNSDTVVTSSSPVTLGSVIINKTNLGGSFAFNSDVIVIGDFTRSDGFVFNTPRTLTVGGNFTTSAGDTFGGSNLNLNFNGSGSQIITHDAGTAIGSLTVNKLGGAAELQTSLTTTATTDIMEGTFDINGNTLTSGGRSHRSRWRKLGTFRR